MGCTKHKGKFEPDGCMDCLQYALNNPLVGGVDVYGNYYPAKEIKR